MSIRVTMTTKLGNLILKRRKELGLSQRGLARKAQISHSAVSRLELGNITPTTDTLDGLARALNLPLNTLLGVMQGHTTPQGKDRLIDLIEQLPHKKRALAEDIIRTILNYET